MKGTFLDKITEQDSTCYLTKIKLNEFVKSLPDGYKDYEVQREIVSNTYLDNLIETVLQKRHIPPIVLVVDSKNFHFNGSELSIDEFKILDGLQRTYRLKLIWDTIRLFFLELSESEDILSLKRLQLSKQYSRNLDVINSNSRILETVISTYNQVQRI